MSKTISTDELPGAVNELLEEHTEFVITKDGEPIARVVPTVRSTPMTLDELRKTGEILGDIEEPTLGEWDMQK